MRRALSRAGRPLEGVRVAVTRPAAGARVLADALRAAGAVPVCVPLTRIVPPEDTTPLRLAAARMERYDWIVFTSPNAVRLVAAFTDSQLPGSIRIAAVGAATATAVHEAMGRDPDVVPSEFSGESLVAAIRQHGPLNGSRILWPRGDRARDVMPQGLLREGAVLDDPIAYRTVPEASAARELLDLVARGAVDVITFTSPSAVQSFVDVGGRPEGCLVAVIGPATAAAARKHGFPVHIEPDQYMISSLVTALERHQR